MTPRQIRALASRGERVAGGTETDDEQVFVTLTLLLEVT